MYNMGVTYTNSLLFTDLASHMHSGPEADREEIVGKATQATTVTYSLRILTNGIARTEVRNDTCIRDTQKNEP